MNKLGRNYKLVIEFPFNPPNFSFQPPIVIELPFTIEFDITRTTLGSSNVCQIRIYNLGLLKRNQLRFNQTSRGTFQKITLFAGYGKNLPIIFTGNVTAAWSVREGVNFITQIECYDGGFAFNNSGLQGPPPFAPNYTQKDVIKSLASSLPFVSVGAIGDYPGQLSRTNSYDGSVTDNLRELTGGGFFIDNGFANALGTNEYIDFPNGLGEINASSGLLGTPVLERSIVRFDMIFEPLLRVGQVINLQSPTEQNFNGRYKVTAVKHKGMISPVVCGSVITTGEFFFLKIPVPVKPEST